MDPAGVTTSGANHPVAAHRRRILLGATIGNLVEWYDWYIYAALALHFADAFFPGSDPISAQLQAAGVFAIGFLVRPIGSLVLGHLADRRGRRHTFLVTMWLMGAGATMIAVAPIHAQVGWASGIWLLFARILQGLAVGGEYGTSISYLIESAPPGRRGLWSSMQYVGAMSGQLVALGVLAAFQFFVGEDALRQGAWRWPFALGAAFSLLAFWLRRNMVEPRAFKATATPDHAPACALARYPRQVAMVMAITIGGTVAFYAFTTWMHKQLVLEVGLPAIQVTTMLAGSLAILVLLQPLIGALADRIGLRPILIVFGIVGSVATVPLFTALAQPHDLPTTFLLVLGGVLLLAPFTAINAAVKASLFPPRMRATGVGLPSAIVVSIFGGTVEVVALGLRSSGLGHAFPWYVAACIGVTLVAAFFFRGPSPHR